MSPAWMPLNIKEYIAGTMHLSTAEHGACMLLMMHLWQNGALPDDDQTLARITRMTPEEWAESRDILLLQFKIGSWGDSPAGRAMQKPIKPSRPAIPRDVREHVIGRDGWLCVYCGDDEGPFDIDHKLPWCRGGKHTLDNLVVACQSCNRSKGSLTSEEWTQ